MLHLPPLSPITLSPITLSLITLSLITLSIHIIILMEQSLQQGHQYGAESPFYWDGMRSNRFPKMKLMHPTRDLIQSGNPSPIQAWTSLTSQSTPDANICTATLPRSTSSGPDNASSTTSNIGTCVPVPRRSRGSRSPRDSRSHTPATRENTTRNLSSSRETSRPASAPSTPPDSETVRRSTR